MHDPELAEMVELVDLTEKMLRRLEVLAQERPDLAVLLLVEQPASRLPSAGPVGGRHSDVPPLHLVP